MESQTIETIDSFLTELSRKELQSLAKIHEVKANLKVRHICLYISVVFSFLKIILLF